MFLAALAYFADEGLGANVLGRKLLEEPVFDSVAEEWSANTLPIGDSGVDSPCTRERIIFRSASANTIIMFNIISAIHSSSPTVPIG